MRTAVLATLILGAGCAAGPAPVALGVADGLWSAALDERRSLCVWLPPGYAESNEAYPVIYLLDGGAAEDYHHVAGLVQFLVTYEVMPASIVVGIGNVDRYRDFTHPTAVAEDLEDLPTGGGSAKFIGFLERELQPHVAASYRTNGHRTIIGQSMGGLLAAEILVDHPQLFDAFVIVSPSLWWDAESLVSRAATGLQAHGATGKRVFVALGSEHPKMHELADALVAAIRGAAPTYDLRYETLREETHATVLHRAVYRALEFLWGGT